MAINRSRRDLLHLGCGTAAALGISALAPAGALGPAQALATQGRACGQSTRGGLLLPRGLVRRAMAQARNGRPNPWQRGIEPRLVRVDAAHGAGVSRAAARSARAGPVSDSRGVRVVAAESCRYVAHVMDKAGADSAHIIGAKAGGAIAMQFAADYPARTRTLSVVHVPVVTSTAAARLPLLDPKDQQREARLGRFEGDGRILGEYVCDGAGNHDQKVCSRQSTAQTSRKTASCSASRRRHC